MSRSAKALERLKSAPRDFTWSEIETVMSHFGYELRRTGGSGRKFIHPETKATLMLHEPHPGSILKAYQVKDAIKFLTQEKHL